ncbi:ERC protein 2-like isoform 13-T14 [Spinachia spinachia]
MPLNIRAKPVQNKLPAGPKSSAQTDGGTAHSRFSRSPKQTKGKQAVNSAPGSRSGLEPGCVSGNVSAPASKLPGGQGGGSRPGSKVKPGSAADKGEGRGSATAPGGKTLSMENIQSLSAAYATSGTMYPCERDSLEPSGGYPKGTMTLGRSTSRSSTSNRTTAMGSTPNIASSGLHPPSDAHGDQSPHPPSTPSLRRQSGRHSQAPDLAGRGEVPSFDLQSQLRELQRENDNLRRELDVGREGRTGPSINHVNFWNPDVKRDRGVRREEAGRTLVLRDHYRTNQDDMQPGDIRRNKQLPLTVQELQEELKAHRDMNSRLQQQRQQGNSGSYRELHTDQDHRGGLSPGPSPRQSSSNLHSPGPKNSARASPSNTYNPKQQEADVIIHSPGYGCNTAVAAPRISPANTLQPGPRNNTDQPFYSPSQGPVVAPGSRSFRPGSPCQVPGCDGFSSLPPNDPSEENFYRLQSEHERQIKELFLLRKTVEEMEMRMDSQKQTLGARDESIQRLLEMLQGQGHGQGQGQGQGHWGRGQRSGIVTMAAQEAEAQLENVHVREIENLLEQLKDKDKQLAGLRERVQGLQTDSSNTDTALTTLEEALSEKERVIEGLREQKDREDMVRLEELNQMRKENQVLKETLSALQPQKLPQSQPPNSVLTQNQRPDGAVETKVDKPPTGSPTTQTMEETVRKCPDITDRLRLLEQEVARNKEESGKSQSEVERLMAALRDAEMDKLCKEKKIADLERQVKSPNIQKQTMVGDMRKDAHTDGHPHSLSQPPRVPLSASQGAMRETAEGIRELERALRESMNTSAHREALWAQEEAARIQAQRQLEELMGALEKTRQELDATKLHLSSTQQSLHERDGHLNSLRHERRKQLEEILEMKQQALLAAISEKDANIALLELSSFKRKKSQEEVMALKREKDKLMHQLKQQTQSRMKLIADNYEEDHVHPQHHPHHSHHLHPANMHHRSLPRGPPHGNHRPRMDQDDEEGIWA